ncbi:hypothetical protein [Streptomyces sp. XD-27]|uniref:hypothetical protein n=1 Tax=Streptomyces sp. XD-27 TaxID=3062779 RepID=UPI0026F46EED|nr:hypothetical protein [Streptomyces sp. XD-27]WKX71021.1 hypothetical protein Q3Y56_14880 [Streptomyces sp. XD-27]
MTAALISRGKGRRAAIAAGAVTLGLLGLTACDKPTPITTVTVGSHSESSEATKGCRGDSKELSQKDIQTCLNKESGEKISVEPGQKVRIGVDPEVADSGWVVIAAGPVMNEPAKSTYRTFDGEELFAQKNEMGQPMPPKDEVTIAIVELGKGKGRNQGVKNMWHFTLKRES